MHCIKSMNFNIKITIQIKYKYIVIKEYENKYLIDFINLGDLFLVRTVKINYFFYLKYMNIRNENEIGIK